ncbi:hypothetical protein HanPSC8_Chr17g0783101 [Helianthus annuus]|nr:hypothetical protein HanPSC8_Chr17g0783101 [Helianthus annuus]
MSCTHSFGCFSKKFWICNSASQTCQTLHISPSPKHHIIFSSSGPFYSLCQHAKETSIVADEHDEESKRHCFLLRLDHYYTI